MLKIAIFYGSTTCYTEIVAEKIQQQCAELSSHFPELLSKLSNLNDIPLFNLKETAIEVAQEYDILLFGISTWDFGEIQEDWLSQWQDIPKLSLDNKIIGLFGLGDQEGYGEWYLDAMGLLYQSLSVQAINWCGFWPTEGYSFTSKLPLIGTDQSDYFCGLALDEDSQYELTDERIAEWCKQILSEITLLI